MVNEVLALMHHLVKIIYCQYIINTISENYTNVFFIAPKMPILYK